MKNQLQILSIVMAASLFGVVSNLAAENRRRIGRTIWDQE